MKLPIRKISLGGIALVRDANGNPVPLAEINAALARAERMEKALRFYADRANYQRSAHCVRSNINHDAGEIARAALADKEPTG